MKKELILHIILYISVNFILFLIDYLNLNGESYNQWWFYWTTIFWGIGILIHGIGTFIERKKK